jgi:orotate phosphoribosyltransferase
MSNLKDISQQLAEIVIKIGAVKLSPEEPFTWASGAIMPIYTDNRILLGKAEYRELVSDGFCEVLKIKSIHADLIAGTATAGIPHATSLANALKLPMSYVRSEPKGHGRKKMIEGPVLQNKNAVLVEDLISTGGSALKAISSLREEGMLADHCLAIFTYGFKKANKEFAKNNCALHTLLTFPELASFAFKKSLITEKQKKMLNDWYKKPFEWGKSL